MEIIQFGLSSNLGGIEVYLKTLWSHIDHSRFHFSFVYLAEADEHPCFYEEFKKGGCDFYQITPRRLSPRRNRRELIELFESHKFDVLHFNSNTLSYMFPIEAAIKSGCKVIVHGHSSETARIVPRTLHAVNKKRLRKFDLERIAVSSLAGEWFFGGKDFSVFPNGIETEKYKFTENNRNHIRQEADCQDKFIIGHAGSFVPAKNHKFIIDVFEQTLKLNRNAVLWLIGDGDSSEIQRIVKEKGLTDKVIFWGRRNDLDVLYAGMDVFLLPSLFEGFPLVLLEAGCEGLPCLVSDRISAEAVQVTDYIFSYSLSEPSELWAKKLLEVAKCGEKDRSRCYLDVAKAGFSIEAEVERMKRLYERLHRNGE